MTTRTASSMTPGRKTKTICSLLTFVLAAHADDTLDTMTAGLTDAMAQLAQQADPAYYVAWELVENAETSIQGTHGAQAGITESLVRRLDVDVRVGTMARDNTHKIRDASWVSEASRPSFLAPLNGPRGVLRALLLRGTDDAYRNARARLIKVLANDVVKVEREDTSDDFAPAPVVVVDTQPPGWTVDQAAWTDLTRETSALYLDFPIVYDSAVQLALSTSTRWLVNNEGTRIHDGRKHARVATWGSTVAEDGMQLQVYDYVDVASAEQLPDRAAVAEMVRGVGARLTELRAAPTMDPWSGPAILRGRASGVFFHEIFGHRVEGHRQKDEDEGQTFTSRVGQAILPDFLSVTDDPSIERIGSTDLNGHYRYDDEGVAAERVPLVQAGILRNFLMSRMPVKGFPRSNGHGRRQPGNAVVARQGNLIISASASVPYATLRTQLLAEVRKQGREFGLIFDDISGGFTFTGRSTPNAFNVSPVTVWKIFPDGRPDQLVRGVDMIGTPLTTFSRIIAASDEIDVFNGVCGAESGWVPVSASAPSLLVKEVEIQRREKANDRPPVLSPPGLPAVGRAP